MKKMTKQELKLVIRNTKGGGKDGNFTLGASSTGSAAFMALVAFKGVFSILEKSNDAEAPENYKKRLKSYKIIEIK